MKNLLFIFISCLLFTIRLKTMSDRIEFITPSYNDCHEKHYMQYNSKEFIDLLLSLQKPCNESKESARLGVLVDRYIEYQIIKLDIEHQLATLQAERHILSIRERFKRYQTKQNL